MVITDIWPSDLMDFIASSITSDSSTLVASGTAYAWNIGTMTPYSSAIIIITGTIKQ